MLAKARHERRTSLREGRPQRFPVDEVAQGDFVWLLRLASQGGLVAPTKCIQSQWARL
jgi:hypothetical protein